MGLKDMLVMVNPGTDHEHSLRLACGLAQAHQAHLVGLHVLDIPVMNSVMDVPLPEDYYEMQRRPYLEAAETSHALFDRLCAEAAVQSEWRLVEGRSEPIIETHARYVDLVVAPCFALESNAPGRRRLIEQLILSLGKPILVTPCTELPRTVGECIVIGWDASREAARAVSDALPLLRMARQVSVVAVDPVVGGGGLGDIPCADICHHLARHGIEAEAQIALATEHNEGAALLDWARGQNADMLVIGGYGHSRLRELLLGGVTKYVLEHAQVPVLFSH